MPRLSDAERRGISVFEWRGKIFDMTNLHPGGTRPVAAADGQATAAMVLGIVGLVVGIIPFFIGLFLGFVPMVLAIVFGGVSMSRAHRMGLRPSGPAIAGLVMGCVQFVLIFLGYGTLW